MHRRFLKLRDAFPKSGDEHAQQVVLLLQRRREEMDAAWEELEEGWKASNERMAECGLKPRTAEESMIKLNVGGSNVTVFWHLLAETEGFQDSTLGALLEGVWDKERIPRDADGCIVIDESPACIRHILNTALNGVASSVADGLPGIATDELPCLIYTSHLMGLPLSVPTHPKYLKMDGGSTILEPFEIAPSSAKVRQWAGSWPGEVTLAYRATRDGFGSKAFEDKRQRTSPETLCLFRVSSGQENQDDSVVGMCGTKYGGVGSKRIADESFVFMLRDGSATRKYLCKPTKAASISVFPITFKDISGDGTIISVALDEHTSIHEEDSPFLALNGKNVVDIEVFYRCSTPAPPTTTAPSTTEPGGDALTGAAARDIYSFGQPIATSLMEERVVLDRAVKEMEAAGARVSAAVGALETVYGPSVAVGEQDTVVELNVRGTRMTTLRSTLQVCPCSALAAMFNDEIWPPTDKDKDEHGRRLIDCSPTCFAKILDVLRMRKRVSWGRGVTPEKQEGSRGTCQGAISIQKSDVKAFRTAVQMYFPGCESFIMGLCDVDTTPAAW